jgi:hypothetical protein
MDALNPLSGSRCTAHSKRSGKPCERSPIPGGTVCHYHGGAAPQVKKSAALRLATLVDPAIKALRDSLKKNADPRVRLMAARDVLDRNGFKPPDRHVVTGADGGALEMDVNASEELASRIAGLIERVRASGSTSEP